MDKDSTERTQTEPASEVSGDANTELAATELTPGSPRPTGRAVPPREVGRFRIEGQLGSGGMGDVFRAYDPVLERAVALKVLHTYAGADGSQRIRRVIREARAAAALTHPNTVTIFEVGEAGDDVFIAMELLEGEDLRGVLERGEASVDQKLRWLLQAARALAAAHERGLVHRDVKPENMFVCKDGALKLLDFGIAKRDEDDTGVGTSEPMSVGPSSLRTQAGRRLGTPRYMAPEQRAGEATDARTDEYAWGLVAFELLTGTDGLGAIETVTDEGHAATAPRLASARLDEMRKRAPELPESVVLAIARTLEPRKEDRFESMATIVRALEGMTGNTTGSTLVPPATTAASAAPATAPVGSTPSLRRLLIMGAVIVILPVAGILFMRAEKNAGAPGDDVEPIRPALPPSCAVTNTRDVRAGVEDRLVVLRDGTAVIARDPARGITLEHETPQGFVPYLRASTAAFGAEYKRVSFGATVYNGEPALRLLVDQNERGGVLGDLSEKHGLRMNRLPPTISDVSTIDHGPDLVAVETTFSGHSGEDLNPSTVTTFIFPPDPTKKVQRIIEEIGANTPSVADSATQLGVAYQTHEHGIHFALLTTDGARIGDVLQVTPLAEVPATAFADETPVVFWNQDHGGKSRLTSSSLAPGASKFSPPAIALDETLGPVTPLTVRLPNGKWVVSWIGFHGGLSTIRVSTLGAGGKIIGPTDVGKGISLRLFDGSTTNDGIALWWHHDGSTIRIANVTCNEAHR